MVSRFVGIVVGVTFLFGAQMLVAPDATVAAEAESEGSALAGNLVREALQAEVAGDAARRAAWLEEALRVDPECAPARWQAGFVRVDNQWLTVDQAQGKFGADPRLAEYRQVRESLEQSPQKDLLLARWCQEKQLTEEARFHWLNVLRVQPDHAEALGALGVQWYNGQLLTRAQVDQQKRKDFKATRSGAQRKARARRWESSVAQWEVAASRGDESLLAAMKADVAADEAGDTVPLVNYLIGQRSEKPRDSQAVQLVSVSWIKVLAQDPAHTKFLVMHAIGHPMDEVRRAAIEELKSRPREDYVPLLLTCARFPVEFAWSVCTYDGAAIGQYTLDIQGLDADVQVDHSDVITIAADFYRPIMQVDSIFDPEQGQMAPVLRTHPMPERTIYPLWYTAVTLGRARDMQTFVDSYNAASREINQRVVEALSRATGEEVAANPREWQAWWKEYATDFFELEPVAPGGDRGSQGAVPDPHGGYARDAGYDLPQERPLYRYSSTAVMTTDTPGVRKSCFAGSTVVWTSTGPRAIETIRPGDRVLAQDVSTGRLDYQAVELATKAAPAPMIKVSVGGEEIVSTLGHPFWVVGQGWKMAKQLEVGSLLHTVSGPVPVEKTEKIPAATAWYECSYNLQVAGSHTYFVGQNRVLVHHLTMLSILDEGSSQVPGW